jgi:hypothetical protein
MPKKSRHRKGFILGKRLNSTRKFHGGTLPNLSQMKDVYKGESSLSWFKNSKESKLDISLYIAKSRAHIENIIVKSTVDLATKVYADINTAGSPSANALGIGADKPVSLKEEFVLPPGDLREGINAKVKLHDAIRNYNIAIEAGRKIGLNNPRPTTDTIGALMTGNEVNDISAKVVRAGDDAHDKVHAPDLLPIEGELFYTAELYIPEINKALNAIYRLIEKVEDEPGGIVINPISVNAANVGETCYNALMDAFGFGIHNNESILTTPLLKDKYDGIYAMRVFFSKDTYEEFEKRLKLLYSFDSFEKSYMGLAKMIMELDDADSGNGGGKGNGGGGGVDKGNGGGKGNVGKGNGGGGGNGGVDKGKGNVDKGNGKGNVDKGNGGAAVKSDDDFSGLNIGFGSPALKNNPSSGFTATVKKQPTYLRRASVTSGLIPTPPPIPPPENSSLTKNSLPTKKTPPLKKPTITPRGKPKNLLKGNKENTL